MVTSAATPTRSASATVFRGALALLSTQPLTWAATLIMTVLLPKYLGAQGLGQSAFLITLAALVGSAVSLGMPLYLVRRIATSPTRASSEGGAALVLSTGVALIVAIALSLGLPFLNVSPTDSLLLEIVLAGMVVTTAQGAIFSILNGQGRHARFAWLNLTALLGGNVAGLLSLVFGAGVAGYLGSSAVVAAVVTALGWRLSGFTLERSAFNLRFWLELARRSLPFLGGTLALQIRAQVVYIVSGLLLPAQAVGWFFAAYRIIAIPVFISTAVTTPLLPVLSRCADRPDEFRRTLRRSLTTILLLTVPFSAMVLVVAPVIPDLFHWGPSFYPAVGLMRILSFQQPLVGADMVIGTALIALHKERQLLRVSVLTAIFNPVMNLVFIPFCQQQFDGGVLAAAVIEMATECLFLTCSIVLLPRGLLDHSSVTGAARVLAAGLGLLVVALLFSQVSLVLAVVGGGLTYAVLVIGLGVIGVDDLLSMRRLAFAARGAN